MGAAARTLNTQMEIAGLSPVDDLWWWGGGGGEREEEGWTDEGRWHYKSEQLTLEVPKTIVRMLIYLARLTLSL